MWIRLHHLYLKWKFKLWAGKFAWDVKAKHCQQTFENKKFVDITLQCFALLPQVNFPANNLNFQRRWRWLNWIQAILINLFYFNWLVTYAINAGISYLNFALGSILLETESQRKEQWVGLWFCLPLSFQSLVPKPFSRLYWTWEYVYLVLL